MLQLARQQGVIQKITFVCNLYSHVIHQGGQTMDIRYENALRTATQAWGRNQPTDALTLRTLKTQAQRMQEMRASLSHPTPTQAAVLQPQ